MTERIDTIVLGGTGYVAGELLRLIAGHPRLRLAAILSDSQAGGAVADAFPHLRSAYPQWRFSELPDIKKRLGAGVRTALFSAAPHGVSAALVDDLLRSVEGGRGEIHCVDISADYRFADAAAYAHVYGHAHGAPHRIADFTCALPEHLKAAPTAHIAHPGCFATAVLLAGVPLLAMGLAGPQLFASGVTGSTGSGRRPVDGTHHPLRHGDLYAYNALAHRHAPEINALAKAASGIDAEFNFVPHSGPFARGIHVTIQAALKKPLSSAQAMQEFAAFYADCAFVRVGAAAPRVKDVACSNYAHLSCVTNGRSIAVMSAIDNLTKGAAGGAVQWMNRLFGWDETVGLTAPAPGWT